MESNGFIVNGINNQMNSIGMRLREERARLSLSQTEMGELAGITKNTQMLYESDKRSPKSDYLAAIASAGVDIAYVVTGIRSGSSSFSSGHTGTEGIQSVPSHSKPQPGYSSIPMYDIEAAAGTGRMFDAETIESTLYFETAQLEAEGLNPLQVVGAKVRGDSMGETLRDGDQVLVDRSHRTPDGVFLLRMGDELRIKRVQRVAGGALMLISDNTHYPPELVKPEDLRDVEILGRCEIRIGRIS